MKTKRNLCALGICLFVAFFISSCEKEITTCNDTDPAVSSSSSSSRVTPTKNRMTICHHDIATNTWSLLTIRNNQWWAHVTHGDVRLDDPDGDGYSPPNACGFVGRLGTGDCNDNIGWIYPGAPEICDNDFDENCNGDADDPCPN